jgi:rsbT antagonist protein RsbS
MRIPILRLRDMLLASVQEELTDNEWILFKKDILDKIVETESDGVVIDITALTIVDSYMARLISETAVAVRLLGAEIVLSGVQAEVALTLTEMGRKYFNLDTALNLDKAVNILEKRIAARNSSNKRVKHRKRIRG